MSDLIKIRRGTAAQLATYTPSDGEMVYSTDTNRLSIGSGSLVGGRGIGREVLLADRTYYVATTGSDSNTGLAVGTPFLTIQKAVNVATGTLDCGIYNVVIQVADGTYTGAVFVSGDLIGTGNLKIQGNSGATSNVVLTVSSGCALTVAVAKRVYIKWLKLTGTGTATVNFICKDGALVVQESVNHQAQVGQGFNQSQAGGFVYVTGNHTLSGNFTYADYADGGTIYNFNNTTTISGTPVINNAFTSIGNLNAGGTVLYQSVTFSGSATGKRYEANRYGCINTIGQATTYLPGNVAGTTANGGLYT